MAAKTVKKATKKAAPKKAATKKATPPVANDPAPDALYPMSVRNTKKTESAVATVPKTKVHVVKGFNPRKKIGDVEELAQSIKSDGLLHFPTVRPHAEKEGHFSVVCGERRYRAMVKIGWTTIPVLIRNDLVGDDARARALAVAENSDDARHSLNAIEIGRVLDDLVNAQGWTVDRAAKECGLHKAKARRCLTLVSAPQDVQDRVEKGDLSIGAGLEVAKLDDDTRKAISKELNEDGISAKRVKELAKKSAQNAGGSSKPGKAANRKKGKSRDAALTAWRGSRTKQEQIRSLCADLMNLEDDDLGTPDHHELRGAIAYALWDRGELETPYATPVDQPWDGQTKADWKKELEHFSALVEAEAEKYEPSEDAEEEGEEE